MDALQWLQTVVLGFVEGLTEFIPVSSTGHLLLLGHFLGFDIERQDLRVLIQLGAILAILYASTSRACGRSRSRCRAIRTPAASSSACSSPSCRPR